VAQVAQLAGYVSEHSAYHHGEQSLASTIIGLAQDFVGSNNINLLVPSGQFGTRLQASRPPGAFVCAVEVEEACALCARWRGGWEWGRGRVGGGLEGARPAKVQPRGPWPALNGSTAKRVYARGRCCEQGGKDAASARYVYTRLAPLARHVFNPADDQLLQYLNEEGQSIEPEW
jgi:hypothetical protein